MNSALDVRLFWVTFWLYLVSFVLYSFYSGTRKKRAGKAATLLFVAGALLHTAGLAVRWWASKHPPMATMFEYSLTMSWVIAIFYVLYLNRTRKMNLGVMAAPLILAILVIASMLPKEASRLMPALQSYWFYIHVSLAAVSEGAFILAAGAGILYLIRLRKKSEEGFLPSADFLEELVSRSIRAGYPLFTIGALFAGAIWAQYAWGRFWSWDPKETGALVIWLFYTLVLHQDIRGRWRGRTLAFMSLLGFLIILLSFVGNLFLGGLHSYI